MEKRRGTYEEKDNNLSFMEKSAMIKLEKKFPLIKKINFLIKGTTVICINTTVLIDRLNAKAIRQDGQSRSRVLKKIFI